MRQKEFPHISFENIKNFSIKIRDFEKCI